MTLGLNIRLSTMMFLQYAIWGAWLTILYPFLTGHLGFTKQETSYALMAGAVGAIVGPFVAGQIADRHFNTERFLGISHLAGAVLVWRLAETADFSTFFWLSLLYGLVYAPTLPLTNSLSLHHVDRDRDFGRLRLWGTIGWIAAGIAVGQWLASEHTPTGVADAAVEAAQNAGRADAFRLSAILGAIMGVYCFTLPRTPPSKSPRQPNAALEALKEVRLQPLATLFLLAVPVSCIHQFYFVHTSTFLSSIQRTDADALATAINRIFGVGGGGIMTIGQVAEVLVIGMIPLLAVRFSRKTLLAVGLLAYAGRMALFAYTTSLPLILVGVALHGVCFGCFIFVCFMVVDEETTPDVRASAQNLFNLVIIGVGIIVGSYLASSVVGPWAEGPKGPDDMDFTKLFSVPMWASLACFVLLLLFYPRHSPKRGVRAQRYGAES
jgi:nucleoside transporter